MTPTNETYTLKIENLVYISRLYNDFLIEFSKNNSIECIDTSNLFSKKSNMYPFYDDCHFNEEGANAMANLIFEYFNKKINR